MHPTRRDLLRLGLGASTLLACGKSVPTFLARSASLLAAEAGKSNKENVLVVLELTGGNDGLNTVIPFKDDDYCKHRPKLNLASAERLHKIDDRMGLHPSLTGFAKLLEQRQLAIVQSVGYPNPNRSHFESMAIWQSARLKPSGDTPGWLARSLETLSSPNLAEGKAKGEGDAPALHISEALLPAALVGSQRHVPSLANLEQFRRRLGMPEAAGAAQQRAVLDQLSSQENGPAGSLLQFVERSTLITYASSARLEAVLAGRASNSATYPEFFPLAQRLRLIAQLIKAGLTTSIYYTQINGFDTHANQLGQHDALLQEVGNSMQAFFHDLTKSGDGQRVLAMVFSEFGRRLAENASGGTDHGTAAPLFLLGGGVRPGLHGPYPNLQDLQDGDPKHSLDFRRIYATILDQWLGCPSERVLGERFEHLPVL
jgi:uncharacterized protein (DUF1501 family)